MRTLFVAVVIWLMAMGVSADQIEYLPSQVGPGTLPDASAAVGDDCAKVPFTPCFDGATAIQDAVDDMLVRFPNAIRTIYVFPNGAAYLEDVDMSETTGFTHLTGVLSGATPIIQGQGTAATVICDGCTIRNFQINQSPGFNALQFVTTTVGRGSIIDGVNFITDGLGVGSGNELVSFENTDGHIFMSNLDVTCLCTAGNCNAGSSCIRITGGSVGSASTHSLTIRDSRIGINSPLVSVVGSSAFRMNSAPKTLISNCTIWCEDTNNSGVNCIEIDDADVSELIVTDIKAFGGVNSLTDMGRWVNVLGAGTGSSISIGHVEGSDLFDVTSVWGSIIPTQYLMGCKHAFSYSFDPDETQDTFISLDSNFPMNLAGPPTNPDPAEANVDTFKLSHHMVPHNLFGQAGTAVVAGSWTIDVRSGTSGAMVDNGAQCSINVLSPFGTICEVATHQPSGLPVPEQFRVGLMISPSVGPAPTASTEMTVNFCLSEHPK